MINFIWKHSLKIKKNMKNLLCLLLGSIWSQPEKLFPFAWGHMDPNRQCKEYLVKKQEKINLKSKTQNIMLEIINASFNTFKQAVCIYKMNLIWKFSLKIKKNMKKLT